MAGPSQKMMYEVYLGDAAANLNIALLSEKSVGQGDFAEDVLVGHFHSFVASLGTPFADRAEAGEIVLDAVASIIAGCSWNDWVSTSSHVLGKQGYRAEALVAIAALDTVGHDPAAVDAWYTERRDAFDDPATANTVGTSGAEIFERIQGLATAARQRPDGYLASWSED